MTQKAKIIVDARCQVPNAHIRGRVRRGKATCGVIIIDERGNEHQLSKYLGDMTVPEAEFNGLIFALEEASAITRYDIEVWMDSELVIKWMHGEYRLKKPHIRPLFDQAKKNAERFRSVEYFHHDREALLAKRADALAKSEYREHQSK
jgi:ribonuclease HI